jgi:hypothetical protein
MDGDDGASALAENCPDCIRRDILRVPVDVSYHWGRPAHDCATSGRNERATGNDYFIARTNTERL